MTYSRNLAHHFYPGVSLGVGSVLVITACSVVTYVRRQRCRDKYTETNVAIHNKYQDASRQISQYDLGSRGAGVNNTYQDSSQEGTATGVLETSFR